jgi:UDP-N-acetylglucosamine 4,6-dehydratase
MQGGEIFVPKIPSVRIVDLAKAMAPKLLINDIGIRPGEKLHEVMCPKDDSHLTIEYDNHFVITPSITFFSNNYNHKINRLNEHGNCVELGYEYDSGTNPHFLSLEEILEYNTKP